MEIPGSEFVAVQEAPVDCPPHVVDALDAVPDHDMGVELRVVGSAGEIGEPCRDIPLGADRPGLDPMTGSPVLAEDRQPFVVQDWHP